METGPEVVHIPGLAQSWAQLWAATRAAAAATEVKAAAVRAAVALTARPAPRVRRRARGRLLELARGGRRLLDGRGEAARATRKAAHYR